MSKEIIINSDDKQTRIAIVENGVLAELYIETEDNERTIGNLFLGRVRRVMPSIQAAFIDIGQKQDAFLHFSDVVDNLPDWLSFVKTEDPNVSTFEAEHVRRPVRKRRLGSSDARNSSDRNDTSDDDLEFDDDTNVVGEAGRNKGGGRKNQKSGGRSGGRDNSSVDASANAPPVDPVKVLKKDLPILVRIAKEPFNTKGSRITTDISLAGRFLVLVPMANYVAVSKKIMSFKERRRLRVLARSLVPEGFGVIVRTVASGRNAKALDTDLRLLIEKWRKVESRLAAHVRPPTVIHEDVNMVSSIIRDLFTEDFDRILIDSQRLYRNIKGYIQAVAPQMAPKVAHHQGQASIFEATRIAKSVEEAFQSRVELPSGGYLFIEHTEAMHVIDVNSGRAGRGLSQEDNSLKVNLEAARVIARQVRLRDLGGILVVDFIDLRDDRNRRKVYDQLRREFRRDRAVTKVLHMSDFGLIQITRQRLRPSVTTTYTDDSDSEVPRKEVKTSSRRRSEGWNRSYPAVEPQDLVSKIEDWLEAFKEAGRRGPLKLKVHPFTAAWLNRKIPSLPTRWLVKHLMRVRVESDAHMDPMSFRFFDGRTRKEITSLSATDEKKDDKQRSTSRSGGRGRSAAGGKNQGKSGGRPAPVHTTGGRSSSGRASGGNRSTGGRSTSGSRSAGGRGGNRSEDTRSASGRSSGGNRSNSGRPSGNRSTGGNRSSGGQASGGRSSGGNRTDGRRTDGRRQGSREDNRSHTNSPEQNSGGRHGTRSGSNRNKDTDTRTADREGRRADNGDRGSDNSVRETGGRNSDRRDPGKGGNSRYSEDGRRQDSARNDERRRPSRGTESNDHDQTDSGMENPAPRSRDH